ncbi:hypothetical protein GEMRC1_006521 [Eukaryota sp. GEM-RC1]
MKRYQHEQQALEYFHERDVSSLLSSMFNAICSEQPDDIPGFLVQHLEAFREDRRDSHQTSTSDLSEMAESPTPRARRFAVSAPVADDSMIKCVPHPKTDEELAMLEQAIDRNTLFQHIDKEARSLLYQYTELQTYSPDSVIIQQGASGDYFYVVYEGICDVYKEERGQSSKVSTIHPGGSFGELALMYGVPRAATVIARTPVKLFALEGGLYRSILMETSIRKRQEYEEFLLQVPILANLTPWERSQLADALEYVEYTDCNVVTEGDDGDSFYVIKEGECKVLKEMEGKQVEMGTLTRANFFGELALMFNQPRAATVRAIGTVGCLKLDRSLFDLIIGPCEDVLKRNVSDYVAYAGNR